MKTQIVNRISVHAQERFFERFLKKDFYRATEDEKRLAEGYLKVIINKSTKVIKETSGDVVLIGKKLFIIKNKTLITTFVINETKLAKYNKMYAAQQAA